jgi:cytochrome b561
MSTLLVSRCHPLLVALHWLLAVLIVAMLGVGFYMGAAMPNLFRRMWFGRRASGLSAPTQ